MLEQCGIVLAEWRNLTAMPDTSKKNLAPSSMINPGASNPAGTLDQSQPQGAAQSQDGVAQQTQNSMALEPLAQPKKRVSKPKKQKVKQGHKLVWLTLLIVFVPIALIGYVLMTSAKESDQPVEGNRFNISDLNPRIQESQMAAIQNDLMGIGGIEGATYDLKSATFRVHLNMVDHADYDSLKAAALQAYDIVNNYLPIDTYFTNSADGKNYDLEIDAYNYLVDDQHPIDGWRVVKVSKSGAGQQVIDILTQPKNAELAQSVKIKSQNQGAGESTPADSSTSQTDTETEEGTEEEYSGPYYDIYGNLYYTDIYGNIYYQ